MLQYPSLRALKTHVRILTDIFADFRGYILPRLTRNIARPGLTVRNRLQIVFGLDKHDELPNGTHWQRQIGVERDQHRVGCGVVEYRRERDNALMRQTQQEIMQRLARIRDQWLQRADEHAAVGLAVAPLVYELSVTLRRVGVAEAVGKGFGYGGGGGGLAPQSGPKVGPRGGGASPQGLIVGSYAHLDSCLL